MKMDGEGTLWMYTGDEGIMDEEGYLRGEYSCGLQVGRNEMLTAFA